MFCQAVEEAGSRIRVSIVTDFDVLRPEPVRQKSPQGSRSNRPAPAPAPFSPVNRADARHCNQEYASRLQDPPQGCDCSGSTEKKVQGVGEHDTSEGLGRQILAVRQGTDQGC